MIYSSTSKCLMLRPKMSHLTFFFLLSLLKLGDKLKMQLQTGKGKGYKPWLNETYQIHSILMSRTKKKCLGQQEKERWVPQRLSSPGTAYTLQNTSH